MSICSEFGAKVVPPKKILKMLPELFDHQDQNVRASSKGLTLELCRWIGKDPVKSILFDKMRDTMVRRLHINSIFYLLIVHGLINFFFFFATYVKKKELEAELSNVTGNAKPTRKIR